MMTPLTTASPGVLVPTDGGATTRPMVSFIPVHLGKGVTYCHKDWDWARHLGDSTQTTWSVPGSRSWDSLYDSCLTMGSFSVTLSRPIMSSSRSLLSPGRDMDERLDSLELDCRMIMRDMGQLLQTLLALPRPKDLLDATFDGDPENLSFFIVQVMKFVQRWTHLFPDEDQQVDFITFRLWGVATSWYVSLHNLDAVELGSVDVFMWALRARFEDRNTAEKVEAFLCTFKQSKLTENTRRNFNSKLPKSITGPNLQDRAWSNVMSSRDPQTMLAWMQEAENAESWLCTMHLDTAVVARRTPATPHPKGKTAPVREQQMKQGLCLKCGDGGHFTANCPLREPTGLVGREGDKRQLDMPSKKGTAKARVLFEYFALCLH
ncbi:UNVERIFIED_CONTAM: hypothetical protein K2H54_003564 [Gekko kuhli]